MTQTHQHAAHPRRLLRLLAVSLVFGLVINIVVTLFGVHRRATADAARPLTIKPPSDPDLAKALGYRLHTPSAWPVLVPTEWPTPSQHIEIGDFGWLESSFRHQGYSHYDSSRLPTLYRYAVDESRFGWPLHTMRCWSLLCDPPGGGPRLHTFHAQFTINAPVRHSRGSWRMSPMLIPTHPIWQGIIANTLIYAAVLALGFIAAGRLRHAVYLRQLNRGECPPCPTCRYDRTGLARDAPCPECGHASPPVA